MTWDIAFILTVDGLATGAVYLLAGLGLVLIFSVTRVVFVPFGDVAAFAALSLAAFETDPTIGLVATLAMLAAPQRCACAPRPRASIPRARRSGVLPLVPCASRGRRSPPKAPGWLQVVASVLLVVPITPLVARSRAAADRRCNGAVLRIVSLALTSRSRGSACSFSGPKGRAHGRS
jgi:branched-chain amino acid transport system permease protein